jgi:hypothetical protein
VNGRAEQRKRFKVAYRVREQMQAEFGTWTLGAPEPDETKRAATLVTECGQPLLDLLIAVVGERSRGDAKTLRLALKDQTRTRKTWIFLAHAQAKRLEVAGASGMLGRTFPLSVEDQYEIDTGPKARALGLWSEEFLYTRRGLSLLLGDTEDIDALTFFQAFEPYSDLRAIDLAWTRASEPFVRLVDLGVLASI